MYGSYSFIFLGTMAIKIKLNMLKSCNHSRAMEQSWTSYYHDHNLEFSFLRRCYFFLSRIFIKGLIVLYEVYINGIFIYRLNPEKEDTLSETTF